MPEELENLLERIQKDGVEKAEAESEKIISEAKEKADIIIKKSKEKAESILKKAEQEEKSLTERGKKSLEQSPRDVILSIHDALNVTLKKLVEKKVSQALTDDTLKKMLVKLVESYFKNNNTPIEILLNPEEQQNIADFFLSTYSKDIREGINIVSDNNIITGFRVSVRKDKVEHDFSEEAITEALCRLLRPYLAEIVKRGSDKS